MKTNRGELQVVQKDEKATEVKLARGPILTTELANLLRIAWADTERWRAFTNLRWRDDRTATVRDVSDLDEIEDAPGVVSVNGQFVYTDGSELKLSVSPHLGAAVIATGATARQRQTEIARLWASFPYRSGLHRWLDEAVWAVRYSLIVGALVSTLSMLGWQLHQTSVAGWLLQVGFLLLGIALWLFSRAYPGGQMRRHPIVYSRSSWAWERVVGVAGLVIGSGSLIVSLGAWLLPRK